MTSFARVRYALAMSAENIEILLAIASPILGTLGGVLARREGWIGTVGHVLSSVLPDLLRLARRRAGLPPSGGPDAAP